MGKKEEEEGLSLEENMIYSKLEENIWKVINLVIRRRNEIEGSIQKSLF